MTKIPLFKAALLSAGVLAAQASYASIAWSTGAAQTIFDSNGTTPLPGDNVAPPVAEGKYGGFGYFVQLVWDAGGDGADAITITPNGVLFGTEGSDDVVIASSYINRGGAIDFATGIVPAQPSVAEQGADGSSQRYFMRAFNVAAPMTTPWKDTVTPTIGLDAAAPPALPIPALATFYGNSNILSTSVANATTTETLAFDGFSTNIPLVTVPEPTSAGLLFVGMLGVIAAARRRSQS